MSLRIFNFMKSYAGLFYFGQFRLSANLRRNVIVQEYTENFGCSHLLVIPFLPRKKALIIWSVLVCSFLTIRQREPFNRYLSKQ